jgi:hypothetical protein
MESSFFRLFRSRDPTCETGPLSATLSRCFDRNRRRLLHAIRGQDDETAQRNREDARDPNTPNRERITRLLVEDVTLLRAESALSPDWRRGCLDKDPGFELESRIDALAHHFDDLNR